MIKLPMDVYIKTLAGYINDEDKLVTYKWLSNELEVHVNIAKQILEEYWNKYKNDIVATILIIGYLRNGEMRVEVVKESNLSDATVKYNKIISQHIYSLQKSLSDIELLANVGPGDTKYSAIHCEKSVLLTDEELFARRWGSNLTYDAPQEERKPPVDRAIDAKKSLIGIGKYLKESGQNNESQHDGTKNKQDDNSDEKKISPPKNKAANVKKSVQSQKTGFNNLFGKVSAINQKKSPPSNSDNENTTVKTQSEVIKHHDNNTNNSVDKSMTGEKIKSSRNHKLMTNESLKVISESSNTEKKSVTTAKSESKSNKNKKKTNRGTKRERSQDSKADLKKRKRIVVVSDSSEESAAESNDEIICDSPPREEIVEDNKKPPSPPPSQIVNGKRKIRKLIDKTFMDEDGYFVTKKEFVYESCSDEDERLLANKIESKIITEPPLNVTKKPKKQTTMMNFFKKL